MKIVFRNLVVIEDVNKMLNQKIKLYEEIKKNSKELAVAERHVFAGPTDIKDAEFWEERLSKGKIPYVLVQAETSMKIDDPNAEDEENHSIRFAKGYFILVEEEVAMIL